jgi:mono/diheme cytochrome c family protein
MAPGVHRFTRMKSVAITVVVTLVVVVALVWLLAATGTFQVAASPPEAPAVASFLGYVMDHSVQAHARGIAAPDLERPEMIADGAHHYAAMCAQCHGAPGRKPNELARGLDPPAPDLAKTAEDWSSSELFWITRNGIRMSAMPAWKTTDEDSELWEVVAFVRKLPKMSSEDYARLTAGDGGHEHEESGAGAGPSDERELSPQSPSDIGPPLRPAGTTGIVTASFEPAHHG